MLTNYAKIALRTFKRHAGYSFINLLGLSIGLAVCVLILLFVRDELSYDRYHEHADDIYRVVLEGRIGGEFVSTATSSAPMGPTMVRDYPEVITSTRIWPMDRRLIRYQDQVYYEDGFVMADSTVFDVFSFDMIEGDAAHALSQPNSVVITASTARKYFGDADPIGKVINYDNRMDFTVTGVVADVPANSHFTFDFLGSIVTFESRLEPVFVSNFLYTYLLLRPGADADALQAKLPGFVQKYVAPQIEQALGRPFKEAVAAGLEWRYRLQKLTDIYLRSDVGYDIRPMGDVRYVYVLSAIALFILLIACINFMNLATARSANRAREVGMRKVMGSTRAQLVRQFLAESVFLAGMAFVLATGLVLAALSPFNDLTAKALTLTGGVVVAMLGIALVTGLAAGIYPAFVLSRFRPVSVLKGSLASGVRGSRFRSVLVVTQFTISIALLAGTGIVFDQLHYMQHMRLGFSGDQVVVLPNETQHGSEAFEAFRQELLANPSVTNVVSANNYPGRFTSDTVYRPEGAPAERVFNFNDVRSTYGYLDALDIGLAAGRDFSRDRATDATDAYLINETAARMMGWTPEEAVGKHLTEVSGGPNDEDLVGTIIGVVKDFHVENMHNRIRGAVFSISNDRFESILVRIRPDDVQRTLDFLKDRWTAYEPGYPYRYVFLDQDFSRLFGQERTLSRIFGYFTALAIFIACLGLFGLASFVTQQRTNEIGVRKVLGASVAGLVGLLTREFTRLVLIAAVVAIPIAYFAMNQWLADFAYRIDISWTTFAGAGTLALLVALATVSYQSIRAASTDPVQALRHE